MDATQEFEDIGHSRDAITTRDTLFVGDFDVFECMICLMTHGCDFVVVDVHF